MGVASVGVIEVYQRNVTVSLWCVPKERHCLFVMCTRGTSLSLCGVYQSNVTVSLWCVPKERHCLFVVCTKVTSLSLCDVYQTYNKRCCCVERKVAGADGKTE